MQLESKQQILERRKEIEQELLDMLKETESDFTLDHVRDAIYHEEDNDDMMKVVAMFDRGGDASELSNVLELVTDAWNFFLTKSSAVSPRPRNCWNIKIKRDKIHDPEMDKTDIPGTFNAGATLGPVNEMNMARIWNKHKQSNNTPLKRKVFVAMSGGVDSSVAAALLKKRGFDVTGVFFKPWSPDDGKAFCNWQEDRQDALRVASKIGIPFKTWDFSKDYGKEVTQYMIDSYRKGLTPNPDVMCNKEIKFGLFLKKALAEGAEYIATGHYAKVKKAGNRYRLMRGVDTNKDQSYFLYTLSSSQLKNCLFPIGEYTKQEIRKMAKRFELANHDKKDSQGVCFVGQLDMKEFLKRYIKPKRGDVKLLSGKTIGQHDGAYYYTIGQRHGLDLGIDGGPYYVISKDIKRNIIYVSVDKKDLNAKELISKNNTWVNSPKALPINAKIQIRYRGEAMSGVISKNESSKTLEIKFKKPVRAIARGQSVVFYRGQEVLGGGIIS